MIQSLPAALQNNLAVTSKLSILKQEATLWAGGRRALCDCKTSLFWWQIYSRQSKLVLQYYKKPITSAIHSAVCNGLCPPAAAAAQPPPLVAAALYRRRALADGMPVAGSSWLRSWWRRSQILASYYLPPADSAKAEAALVLKLCCIRRIILKQNKKKKPMIRWTL